MGKRLLLLLGLLPGLLAASPAPALQPRAAPLGDRCIPDGPRLQAGADQAATGLGTRKEAAAVRRLLDLGAPGCDALATWLAEGAPGATRRDLIALARPLGRGGDARHLIALLGLLDRDDPQVTTAVLQALTPRLPILDEATSERLADLRGAAAAAALGPLMGGWRRAETRRLLGESIEVEHELVAADSPPPRPHVRAAMDLITGAESAALDQEAAALLASLARQDAPGLEAWGPLLGHLLRTGTRRSRRDAAFALGRVQPKETPALLAAIQSRTELVDAFLDGTAERIRAGRADAETRRLLAELREELPGRLGRRAAGLEKRALRSGG